MAGSSALDGGEGTSGSFAEIMVADIYARNIAMPEQVVEFLNEP